MSFSWEGVRLESATKCVFIKLWTYKLPINFDSVILKYKLEGWMIFFLKKVLILFSVYAFVNIFLILSQVPLFPEQPVARIRGY